MIKFRRFFGFVLLFLSFFNMPAMGMEVQVNEEAFFNQKFPSAVVSGKIVFQSNRDGALSEIWVLENGQMRKIASGKNTDENVPKQLSGSLAGMLGGAFADLSEPRWSPDGKSILCLRDKQLVILDVNGAIQSEIQPAKYPLSARWASDGLSVYYTAADRLPKGGGSQNIYLLNLADKSEKRITDLPPLPGVRPILSFAISSDDKRIVMTSMGEKSISIWIVNTDGSDFKMLVKYAREPNWSPDGKKIAYSSSFLPNGEKTVNQRNKIFIFDLETKKTTQVTQKDWEDRNPIFSPDGTKIAFESYRHRVVTHGSELFVINVDGTGEARLTPPKQNSQYPNDMFRGWSTDQYPDWHA